MQQRDFQSSDPGTVGRGLLLRDEGSSAVQELHVSSALPLADPPADDGPNESISDARFRIHEYERCRMGQELHDSAGQLLVSLQLSIARLRSIEKGSGHDGLMDEIQGIVGQIDREIRSLAFLHYPVELGDRCLCSAVQSLALGFGRRTGIHTSFRCEGDRSPVNQSISTALLRVAQEALVNIHRHSHASSARVVLVNRANRILLMVSDDGVGLPKTTAFQKMRGIGLQSMRHRVESLGGHFEMRNLKHGTRVSASVPLAA